jgi:2-polyprenyl-3-methyl-5-hydroxy-6-metoxy-1,4-benzoquinol methylase
MQVSAIPLDPIIPGAAEAQGVEIISGDWESSLRSLVGRQFDCVLLSNVLHLVPDPVAVLSSLRGLLSAQAVAIVSVPNLGNLSTIWGRVRGDERCEYSGSYEATGVHKISRTTMREWCRETGFELVHRSEVLPRRAGAVGRVSFGALRSLLATEFVAVLRKA